MRFVWAALFLLAVLTGSFMVWQRFGINEPSFTVGTPSKSVRFSPNPALPEGVPEGTVLKPLSTIQQRRLLNSFCRLSENRLKVK